MCGVLLQWDRLSAELSSGRATHFTVIIPVANGPLGAVPDGRETVPRRCADSLPVRASKRKLLK